MNQKYQNEKDLKWLCYRILRAWRVIVVVALVVGLALGTATAVQGIKELQNTEFLEEAKQNYEREYASWVATGENLQIQLKNLEKAKLRQQEYNENSVLMQIDPLRKNVASVEMYVDYEYQIDPTLSLQPIDLSSRILKSYATYMTGGEMYQHIIENLDYDIEVRYLTEILTVSLDYDNNMISLEIVHINSEKSQEILNLAVEGIQANKAAVSAAIAEHELVVNNQADYEVIDLELEDTQEANVQYLSEVDISIQEANEEFQEWAATPKPTFKYDSGRTAIVDGIKKMIVGGVLGAVVVAVIVALAALLSGKLLDPEEMRARFGLRIIGKLPQKRVKKPLACISRVVAAFGGITSKPEDFQALARMVGASVRSNIAAKDETKEWTTVALTGTVEEETLQQLAEAMSVTGYTVVCASDVLTNADAVEKVCEADCVVLVEAQEKTALSNVVKELEALKAWNKPVLGAVILNTDAVM